MKNKGFTLVELLAVIVVLAIISIITIPMIGNVIEESREAAFKDSVLSAFNSVEYYVMDNNLGDIPENGIEVKLLNLKNNNFKSGKIVKNSLGLLTAEFLSDGNYCATGLLTNLNISKGECEITSPTIEVSVERKNANIKVTDEYGIIGYMITESINEPSEWEEIDNVTSIEETKIAEKAGTYYVHVKNKYGKVNVKEYIIERNAFSINVTVINNSEEVIYEFPKGETINLSQLGHVNFVNYTFEGFVLEGSKKIITEITATEDIRLNCSYRRNNASASYTHEINQYTPNSYGSDTLYISNFVASEFTSGSLSASSTGYVQYSGGLIYAGQSHDVGVTNGIYVQCYPSGMYQQSSANLTLIGRGGLIK